MTAEEFLNEKAKEFSWNYYPPSKNTVLEWMEEFLEPYEEQTAKIDQLIEDYDKKIKKVGVPLAIKHTYRSVINDLKKLKG